MIRILLKYTVINFLYFTRRFPRIRGRFRLAKILFTNKKNFHPKDRFKVTIKDVGQMLLMPYDFVDKYLFIYGEYEGALVRLLKSLLVRGSNVLDIGVKKS